VSKTISTIVTYPYILAKVRLQWKSYENVDHVKYTSSFDVLAKIIKEDGVLGLFKVCARLLLFLTWKSLTFDKKMHQGMTPQIIKGVLSQAILFMMKEEIMAITVRLVLVYYAARKLPAKKV